MVLKTCGELPDRNTMKQQGSNLSLPLQCFDSHVLLQSCKTTPSANSSMSVSRVSERHSPDIAMN